jgi:hypothetical protein
MRQVFAPNDTCRFFFARPIANRQTRRSQKESGG